jgi:hypothetical protein
MLHRPFQRVIARSRAHAAEYCAPSDRNGSGGHARGRGDSHGLFFAHRGCSRRDSRFALGDDGGARGVRLRARHAGGSSLLQRCQCARAAAAAAAGCEG